MAKTVAALKSSGALSKFGTSDWSRQGVRTYSSRGSSVWVRFRVSKKFTGRSKVQWLSRLKVGIVRLWVSEPSASGLSS